jgi:ubiquinone/menaquinone biosynthesis C-methylase UbiE
MQNRISVTILNGVNAPFPLIDLDKISEIVADTYNHIAPIYVERHLNDFILLKPLKVFTQLLKEQHKQHILNIASGPGGEATFLLVHGFSVVGIDISSEMIRTACQHTPKGIFHQMKMHELHFPDGTFDAIWSARALIHIPKALLVDLLVTWKRVLKTDGILGVSVIIGTQDGWQPEEYATDRYMFNQYFARGEIEEALELAGYMVLHSQTMKDGAPLRCTWDSPTGAEG